MSKISKWPGASNLAILLLVWYCSFHFLYKLKIFFQQKICYDSHSYESPSCKLCKRSSVMHLSLVCPRMGGSGNPGELDFVKHTWVGILTSTTIPGVGNLTRCHLERLRGSGNEWRVLRHLGKYPEFIWASLQRPRMAERKLWRSIVLSKNVILCPSVLCFKVLLHKIFFISLWVEIFLQKLN